MTFAIAAALLGCCSVFLLIQALGGIWRERKNRLKKRLDQYFSSREQPGVQEKRGSTDDVHFLRQLMWQVARFFAPQQYTRMVTKKLAQAHLLLRPEEFLALHLAALLGGGGLGFLVGGGPLVILAGAGMGMVLPLLFLEQGKVKRATRFNNQIGDALVLISNSLKAGYGLFQAMEVVSREMPSPIAQEFGQVLKEINLGVGTEEALQNMGQRVKSDDWDMVLTAVLIQRQVGGNLAEVLEKIAATIRERIRLQRELKTLTAQGRLSGVIISLLPFALGLFLLVSNPSYLMVLFRHPLGIFMVIAALAAQVVGIIFIRRIVRIEA